MTTLLLEKSSFAARSGPEWLRGLRSSAHERFTALGLPTSRLESWKFTNLSALARTPFTPSRTTPPGVEDLSVLGGAEAVLSGGGFLAGDQAPEGVEILSLGELLESDPSRIEPWLGRLAHNDSSAFPALNTAEFQDGVAVFVRPGAVVDGPIRILLLEAPASSPTISFPRILVVAGARSEVRIVEFYRGRGLYCRNTVTEVFVGEGAHVEHHRLQEEGPEAYHVATLEASLSRSGRFTSHAFSFGSALSRTDIRVRLGEEGSECALNGLFVAGGDQQSDTHTVIDHLAPHTTSRELYKGVVGGRGRGVFTGTIVVEKGAQKTDAQQTNKNVLLSREALVSSTPQLRILADDVKCKHGSTTGQLDPQALFYLRSRGLGSAEARRLLVEAFGSDLVGRVAVESLRRRLEADLALHLPQEES